MSSMKAFQKQATKVITDALIDPTLAESGEEGAHADHPTNKPIQKAGNAHVQSGKASQRGAGGGQKSTGRKKV